MALTAGTHIGQFEIVDSLGAGGMGEVYRATDTKLKRQVALKVLPEAVAQGSERLARFRREAELLASLNHPNIAHIHGYEESDNVHALIMELVEGPTLAERLEQVSRLKPRGSGLPLTETLPIARQIADALDAAHERGVVHRDLKPANIKVRDDGTVKVLDFGLAKAMALDTSLAELSQSPTMAAHVTAAGVIVGTASYMSPEQARGLAIDKRTDLWAFGCVLYEMVTGRAPFEGATTSDVLAAVLTQQPDLSALPSSLPSSIRDLIVRCLEKDRAKRIGDIAVAQFVLATPPAPSSPAERVAPPIERRGPRPIMLAATAGLVAGALAAGSAIWIVRRPIPPRVTRTTIASSSSDALSISGTMPDLAISRDGDRVIYIGENGVLLSRTLDALDPVTLTAGGIIRQPFVSPDGQWVGFESEGALLRKVAVSGGTPITLTRLPDGNLRGGTWSPDHTIIFSTGGVLARVSDNGGTPAVIARPDTAAGETGYSFPALLPDGKHLLVSVASRDGATETSRVVVRDLQTGVQKVLLRDAKQARYVNSGHVVYLSSGQLFAAVFDLARLDVRGTPYPVVPRVVLKQSGAADYAVSDSGTLVYVDPSGSVAAPRRTLVWTDRAGREEPLPAPPRAYAQLRLSPDEKRVALYSGDDDRDVWIWDFAKSTLTRLTSDAGADMYPVWAPDGDNIFVGSQRGGGIFNLWRERADGTGAPQHLISRPRTNGPHSFTPDGKTLVFEEIWPGRGRDLMRVSLETLEVTPVLQTPFEEISARVSPNGRWLAYTTDATGRMEVHTRPFPNAESGHWQVSFEGGREPIWTRNGKELIYHTPDGAMMSVDVDPDAASWNAATPKKLFDGRTYSFSGNFTSYGVTGDGQRFLMIKNMPASNGATALPRVVVVQHWEEELKRLAAPR